MQEEAVAPRSRWRFPFTWLGLLALAWFIVEVTHQPALGAVAVCLKFGWEDFSTARWLSQADPNPWRRRSTSWLYLAWGLWKTALVAFLMSIGFAVVAPRNPPGGVPDALRAFLSTFLTTLIGFSLSTLLTGVAVLCAWRGEVRLWLDSAVHRARRADQWPPAPLCEGRPNRLGHLLLTALALGFLVALATLLAAASAGLGGASLCFIVSVGAPVALLVTRDLVMRKVWAESPYECWSEPEWEENETDAS